MKGRARPKEKNAIIIVIIKKENNKKKEETEDEAASTPVALLINRMGRYYVAYGLNGVEYLPNKSATSQI